MLPLGEGWDLPPGAEPWTDFHWFQASTRYTLRLVVLSDVPTWYTGHFVGGRMCPCSGPGCDYCAGAIGAQVRFCFGVVEPLSRRVGLIEFGRSNGMMIRDWANRSGSLKGVQIEVSKHSKSSQSRTEVKLIEETPPLWIASLQSPDPGISLYLTWHKAGMRMPAEFEARMAIRSSQRNTW